MKPIHVKPAFYTFCFQVLKKIAQDHGYNLLLHGSINRDLDLVIIPWSKEISDIDLVISKIANSIGGKVLEQS